MNNYACKRGDYKMNCTSKIAFILCTNDDSYLDECTYYINCLHVPDNMQIEIIPVKGATSMTAGYNAAMKSSSAKYKVYLHQDVFILNRNFIFDIISCFNSDNEIGLLGVAGTDIVPRDASIWQSLNIGGCYSIGTFSNVGYIAVKPDINNPATISKSIDYIDGMLIATSKDIEWDERITGFHFYDITQCIRFHDAGFKVCIPHQNSLWTFHDFGPLNLKTYNQYRQIFCNLYEGFDFNLKEASDNSSVYELCEQIAVTTKKLFSNKRYNDVKSLLNEIGNAIYFNTELLTSRLIMEIRDLEMMSGDNTFLEGINSDAVFQIAENKFQQLKWAFIRVEFGYLPPKFISELIMANTYSIWAVIVLFLHSVIAEKKYLYREIGQYLSSNDYLTMEDWQYYMSIVIEYEEKNLASANDL